MATKNPQTLKFREKLWKLQQENPQTWKKLCELQQAVKGFERLVIDSAVRYCDIKGPRITGLVTAELNLHKAIRKLKRGQKALEEAKQELFSK